ncbi:putative Late nodulin [Medicago truncatula]|uniref:Nodule Cysteine-Rich (NCR) secreted peptide n=1 Tax=Medicago truncatula TaxID=3880 RepID=A7KH81_MEDTR|nr:nodule-specific cysteine-rich peptide 77 [Medicago truncatula]AES70932.1 Nodule Cysteine-Rich (NCR) secreted peptide [Medicago truncatula]RHN68100.1 putative Late nodulin [Medicago truncatula]
MAHFLMFVYALITCLSLFLVEMGHLSIHCVSVDDCPKVEKPITMKCINNYCKYFVDHKL